MKKVLIISIISGFGHLKAAQSIEKALKKYGNKVEVKHINVLDFMPRVYDLFLNKGYIFVSKNLPWVYSMMYNATDKIPHPKSYLRRIEKEFKKSARLLNFIREFNPDIIVATHYFASQLICEYKKRELFKQKLISVCTDYGVHSYLMLECVDVYILPDEIIAAQLRQMGFKNQIKSFGIPADPSLKNEINIKKTMRGFGLSEDKRTILFFCSNYKLKLIYKVFSQLARINSDFQVIATGGRNEKVLKTLGNLKEKYKSKFAILPIGITDRIYDLMKISDITITKPGGLTTAESLICGLPMIVLNPIPGQEENNADMLQKAGAAIKIKISEIKNLSAEIQSLFSDAKKFEAMKKAAVKLSKPNASDKIADFVMQFK